VSTFTIFLTLFSFSFFGEIYTFGGLASLSSVTTELLDELLDDSDSGGLVFS